MRRGFTLVELSIVLVIIGLLTGGILAAQSLIESVKITRQVSDLQQYNIVIRNFEEKFRQLPGDSILFQPPGNNDGQFNSLGLQLTTESAAFWKHLSDSNMLQEEYTNILGGSGTIPGENYPEAQVAEDNPIIIPVSLFQGGATQHWSVAPLGRNNLLFIGDFRFTAVGTTFVDNKGIPIAIAAAVDRKMDDGIPMQGNVNSMANPSGNPGCYLLGSYDRPYDIGGRPDDHCNLVVRVLTELPF